MVDMRPLETHHIGDERMRRSQLPISLDVDGRLAVPAKGLERLRDELLRVPAGQAAVALRAVNELEATRREDAAPDEDLRGTLAQRGVADQVQTQERREHPERVSLERRIFDGTEGCRVHRNAGHRKVVVADRSHAHDGEQAAHDRELLDGPETNRAVTLHVQAIVLAGLTQAVGELLALLQHLGIDIGDEIEQGTVLRHLGFVHAGQCPRKQCTDVVGFHKSVRLHGRFL